MGEARQTRGLSDAAGRRAAGGLAARSALSRFWRDERGATAVELGVIVALISVALIAGLNLLGGGLKAAFNKTSTALGT